LKCDVGNLGHCKGMSVACYVGIISLDLVDVLYNSLDNESISQWFKIGCINSSRMS
jgi:hypothetical protein